MPELSSLESLQQSYDTLKRHVEALEQEWQDAKPLQDLNEFETEFFEEHTAKELGVAGALAVGLSVVHSTVKALLPAKVAAPMVGGAWFVGGALIAWRLTAGTVAGWVGLVERNSKRKRTLARKLQLIEDRIQLLLATQEMLSHGGSPPAVQVPPGPSSKAQQSPAGSTGSSAELVEAPGIEESGPSDTSSVSKQPKESGGNLESWSKYASLGRRK